MISDFICSHDVFVLRMHPLIVHVTVVWVSTAAVAVGLAACWPWFRLWAS